MSKGTLSQASTLRSILLTSAFSLSAPAVFAQTPGNGTQTSTQIDEIIVTARRKAENLQTVPVAVTVFQGADLESRDIGNISQFGDLAPNVTLKPTASLSGASNASSFFIRGIGQTDFAITTDPGVATYQDGVYIARSVGGVLDTLDVESVEVLRGPQGTLFGRNTIGGAINLRTRRPADKFGADISATIGSRNRRDLAVAVDVPLSDNLRARASALLRNQDGYVERLVGLDNGGNLVATGGKDNATTLSDTQGNKNSDTYRLTLGRSEELII